MTFLYRFITSVTWLVALAISTEVLAQQTESRIVGQLLDASKASLPGVTVTVTAKDSGVARTDLSGGDGEFAIGLRDFHDPWVEVAIGG